MMCCVRAGNGTRTRDPNLGKVVLYQLSYSRDGSLLCSRKSTRRIRPQHRRLSWHTSERLRRGVQHNRSKPLPRHGGERDRTADLLNAIQALSQLSYAPSSRRTKRQRNSKKQQAQLAAAKGYRQEPPSIAQGISSVNELGLAKIL